MCGFVFQEPNAAVISVQTVAPLAGSQYRQLPRAR